MTEVGAQRLAVLGSVLPKAAGLVAEIDRDLDLVESAEAAGLEAPRVGSGLKHCNVAGSDILDRCQPDFLLRARCPHHKQFHRLWNRQKACFWRGSIVFLVQSCSGSNLGFDLSLWQFHPAGF